MSAAPPSWKSLFRAGPRQVVQLVGGLLLYGAGMALMVRAVLGVAPWDVLTQGVGARTGMSFGLVTLLVSIVVFALWIPLRQRPGLGTILNILVIPVAAQGALWLLPEHDRPLWVRALLLVGGLLAIAVASGLYIGVNLGPGPRDGLMTGLHDRLGWPIWLNRTIIEVVVTAIGWLLGGDLGVGTFVFAFLIGPAVQLSLRVFGIRARPADAVEAAQAA